MRSPFRLFPVVLFALGLFSPQMSHAGGYGRAVARGAFRGASRPLARSSERAMARVHPQVRPNRSAVAERLRDLHIRPKAMPQARTVRRAVTAKQLRVEQRHGISMNRHLTSRPARGRIPTAGHFQKTYGIRHKVGYVETVRIPKGHPVRFAKVWGGGRGRGEMTSPKRLPPRQIVAVHRGRGPATR